MTRRSRLDPLSLRMLVLLTAIAGVTLVAAWAIVRSGDTRSSLSAEEILEDPHSFYGMRVEVEDEVTAVVGATALTLGGSEGEGGVLVLDVSVMPALDDVADLDRTPVGDVVYVEGELHPFHVAQFERLVGELDDDAYRPFEGQPALVAEVVRPAPRAR